MAATAELHPLERSHLPTAEEAERQDPQKDKAVTEALAADKGEMEITTTQEAETRRMAAEEADATEPAMAAQAAHMAVVVAAVLSETVHIGAVQVARKEHMAEKAAIMERQAQPELTRRI